MKGKLKPYTTDGGNSLACETCVACLALMFGCLMALSKGSLCILGQVPFDETSLLMRHPTHEEFHCQWF